MKHISEIQIRDPFVLKANNQYYLYGSTDINIWGQGTSKGFDVYTSKDLENWEGPYQAFYPGESYWGKDNFWAPEVHFYKDMYYMFATFRGENRKRGTAILKSSNPLGPFIPWSDGAVTPKEWMSLDGTFYIDLDGQPWIVFCHEWVQIKEGTICAMRLTEDMKSTFGEPIILLKSKDAPWSGEVYSKEHNMSGWVTDGPNMHRLENGKLIMIWSCMSANGYTVGCAISENNDITGKWNQEQEPLFMNDGGHGMIFTQYNGQITLAIHYPNDTPNERAIFVPLKETDDGLEIISKEQGTLN